MSGFISKDSHRGLQNLLAGMAMQPQAAFAHFPAFSVVISFLPGSDPTCTIRSIIVNTEEE
jgi:hypothetical protein